jgi:AcrR family transcriptional regulator
MNISTRQQIMDAAEKLLQTKGLAYVTTRALAKETGLSEGALYRHFERKEDVFLAVLGKTLTVLAAEMSQALPGQGSVRDNLLRIGMVAIHSYAQLIPLASAFFSDNELLARFALLLQDAGGPEKLFERVAEYVGEEQGLGRIDATLPTMTIVSLLLGPCFQRVYLHQVASKPLIDDESRVFVEGIVDLLMRAIAPI